MILFRTRSIFVAKMQQRRKERERKNILLNRVPIKNIFLSISLLIFFDRKLKKGHRTLTHSINRFIEGGSNKMWIKRNLEFHIFLQPSRKCFSTPFLIFFSSWEMGQTFFQNSCSFFDESRVSISFFLFRSFFLSFPFSLFLFPFSHSFIFLSLFLFLFFSLLFSCQSSFFLSFFQASCKRRIF